MSNQSVVQTELVRGVDQPSLHGAIAVSMCAHQLQLATSDLYWLITLPGCGAIYYGLRYH